MMSAAATRKIATTVLRAGGGLGFAGGSAYGLLHLEVLIARYRIGVLDFPVPNPTGLFGETQPGELLRLAVLGDSAAAGYGATDPDETFGAMLATSLAEAFSRPVSLGCHAIVGAQTSDLARQIDELGDQHIDASAIIVGTNDVTHRVRASASIHHLEEAIGQLQGLGAVVAVGTCPDLGTVRPIPPPLRQVARQNSRRLAEAQAKAAREAGGVAVALGTLLGPEFAAAPAELFGPDRFHPSPAGYRRCADAMLPALIEALDARAGASTEESDATALCA
jgi:lysophospholipase L1-like esterase